MYIVSPYGVTVTEAIGTFPAYTTITGGAVTTDTVDAKMIHVDNWPHNEHDTQDIIDAIAGYIFLPNDVVGKITGVRFNGPGTSPDTFKLDINVDVDSAGTGADFHYIANKDAVQNWRAKVDNQGSTNIVVNDTVPIVGGHSSVFGKAQYLRPLKIDASLDVASSAVVSNAVY